MGTLSQTCSAEETKIGPGLILLPCLVIGWKQPGISVAPQVHRVVPRVSQPCSPWDGSAHVQGNHRLGIVDMVQYPHFTDVENKAQLY